MPVTSVCVVNGCKNSIIDKYCRFTDCLFRFPANETRAREWVIACNREDLLDKCHKLHFLSFRVCSLHFEPTVFTSDLCNRLRSGSVPTIFPELSNNPEEDIFEVQQTTQSHSDPNNDNKFSQNQRLPEVEIPQEVQNSTETVHHQPCRYNMQIHYQLPPENVTAPSIQGSNVNILPRLFLIGKDTNEVFQIPIKLQLNKAPKEYKCRTCLHLTNEATCTGITNTCFSDKTLKDVITQLVPQMELTLNNSDVICSDCFKILDSCMKFILQCLETEKQLNIAKVVGDACSKVVIDECDLIEMSSTADGILMSIESEHDYCQKTKPIDESLSNIELKENNSILQSILSGRMKTRKFRTAKSLKVLVPGHTKPKVRKKYKKKVVPKEVETNVEKMFSCTVCSKKFTSEDFKIHLEIHPPYQCDICDKAFVKKSSLENHKISHNDPNTFLCEICGKGCKAYLALKRHQQSHSSEKSMVCDKCAKMFRDKWQLSLHIKYVHNRNFTVQCPHCGLMSKSLSVLKSHINLVHLKVKPHQCNICGRQFGRRDYLQHHLERHATASPKDFEECSRTKVIGNEHVTCKLCGKVVEGRRLQVHLKRHINRYKCHYCPQTFVAKCTRNKHEVVHESMAVFFRCNVCYRKFRTKEELEEHAATQVHRRPPRYSCDICGQKFHRRFTLSQHTLTQHVAGLEKKAVDLLVCDDVLENNEIKV